jgi:hypothetical protein
MYGRLIDLTVEKNDIHTWNWYIGVQPYVGWRLSDGPAKNSEAHYGKLLFEFYFEFRNIPPRCTWMHVKYKNQSKGAYILESEFWNHLVQQSSHKVIVLNFKETQYSLASTKGLSWVYVDHKEECFHVHLSALRSASWYQLHESESWLSSHFVDETITFHVLLILYDAHDAG